MVDNDGRSDVSKRALKKSYLFVGGPMGGKRITAEGPAFGFNFILDEYWHHESKTKYCKQNFKAVVVFSCLERDETLRHVFAHYERTKNRPSGDQSRSAGSPEGAEGEAETLEPRTDD